MDDIIEILKNERIKQDFNLSDLSRAIGYERHHILQIEMGLIKPSIPALLKYLDVLGLKAFIASKVDNKIISPLTDYAHQFRSTRLKMGFKQKKVAEDLKMSHSSHLCEIERHRCRGSYDILIRILDYFNWKIFVEEYNA